MKKLFKTHPKHGSTQAQLGAIAFDASEPTQAIASAALADVQAPSGSPYMTKGPSYGAAVPPSPDAALAQLATQRQADYLAQSHSHPSPQRDRPYRQSRNLYSPSTPEENWEVVQPSDYDLHQGHSPYLERKHSNNNTALPNPHPPVVATTRSSSLNSLPGVPSQPLSPPLSAPAPRSASPYSVTNSSPVIPQATGTAIDSHSAQHMLRRKNRDPPQSDLRSPSAGGPAAILRALEPSGVSPQQNHQTIKLVQPSLGRPSIEVTPRSPTTERSFDEERDSLEIERERLWRERDKEIYNTSEKRSKRKDKPGLLQKVRPDESVSTPSIARPEKEKESKNLLERLHLQPDGDSKKRRDGSHERADKRRSREIDLLGSGKETKEVKEDKKLQWGAFLLGSKDKDKGRGRLKDKESDEQLGEELTRMIGFATAVSTLDMTIVFEICDRASLNEHCAKQAAKALRRELKYGEPSGQISAARLWAIMLQNCSELFITQTSSRKFLDTVEDLITSSRTQSHVRDALINVLGTAAYISSSRGAKDHPFKESYRSLWRKIKPPDMPDDGIPPVFEDRSPVTPTPFMPNIQQSPHGFRITNSDPSLAPEEQQYPRPRVRERVSSRNGIIPVDEDIRRLFQECKIGKGNAALLSEALAFAKPEDLKEKGIIKEFYSKCLASQELIVAQIPWATAGAERSRLRALEERNSLENGRRDANAGTQTREEKLLAELLKANEELTEALKIYADLERIDVEKEFVKAATERSQTETRMNGYDYAAHQDSSSFLLAPSTAPSSSRSPSPASIADPSYLDAYDAYASSRNLTEPTSIAYRPQTTQQQARPLPLNGMSTPLRSPQASSHPHLPRSLHGPRMISSTGTRSRSPSPARSLVSSRPGSRAHSRNGSLETASVTAALRQVDLDSSGSVARAPSGIVSSFQISEKAAGKRKMVDVESPNLDDDDNSQSFHLLDAEGPTFEPSPQSPTDPSLSNHWNAPVQYVYDAAAERTKEWLEHEHVGTNTAKV